MRITAADLAELKQRTGSRSRGDAMRRSRPGTGNGGRVAPQRERDIQREILDYLAQLPGVCAWKSGAGMFTAEYKGRTRRVRMGKRGVADIIGWRRRRSGHPDSLEPARFLAIEVKAPGREPTLEQRIFLDRVLAAGGIAICATSVADVRRVME